MVTDAAVQTDQIGDDIAVVDGQLMFEIECSKFLDESVSTQYKDDKTEE